MDILVTGGAGYIGSHTCIKLLEAGYNVIIADNLSNSNIDVMAKIKKISKREVEFYNIDVTDEASTEKIFKNHDIEGIIHFAGFKAVGESVLKPINYYYNNLLSTITLCKLCSKYSVHNFVFSSSATVYGDNKMPFIESMELMSTTNPYGESKRMNERILSDFASSNSEMCIILLRYFNPIGAHESGLIGEVPNGIPNNLMPYITQVAKGKLDHLRIFGDDYNTPDGTGVRDYIHVMDLADGHVAALRNIKNGVSIYNLGTGKGTSVLELVHTFEKVNNIKIPYEIVERRPGDIAEFYANCDKAKSELNWVAKKTIVDMVRDSWNFESNNNFI